MKSNFNCYPVNPIRNTSTEKDFEAYRLFITYPVFEENVLSVKYNLLKNCIFHIRKSQSKMATKSIFENHLC